MSDPNDNPLEPNDSSQSDSSMWIGRDGAGQSGSGPGPDTVASRVREQMDRGGNASAHLDDLGDSPGGGGNSKLIILGIGAGVALVALLVLVMISQQRAPAIQQQQLPDADVGVSMDEAAALKGFTSNTTSQVQRNTNDLNEFIEEQRKFNERIQAQLNNSTRALTDAADSFREQSDRFLADIRRQQNEIMQEKKYQADYGQVLEEYRIALRSGSLSPTEARRKAIELLKQSGLSDAEVASLIAKEDERVGTWSIGDISEELPSADEIDSLPEHVRPMVVNAREYLYSIGLTDGVVLWQDAWPKLRAMVGASHPGVDVSDADIQQLARVARIRRENLDGNLQGALAQLDILRKDRGISLQDLAGIQRMIWQARSSIPRFTPGQHLSLVHVLSRSVSANDRNVEVSPEVEPQNLFRQPTQDDFSTAGRRAMDAVKASRALGVKTPGELLGAAEEAIRSFANVSRVAFTDKQITNLANIAVAEVIAPTQSRSPDAIEQPANDEAVSQQDPAAKTDESDYIYMGPLRLTSEQLVEATWLMAPLAIASEDLDGANAGTSAAIVSLWEQSRRLADEHFQEFANQPLGGLAYWRTIYPRLLEVASAGDSLKTLRIFLDENRYGNGLHTVRGGALGTYFGRFIHDSAQSQERLPAFKREIENPNLVNEDFITALNEVPDAQVWRRTAMVFGELAPGRLPYPPMRVHTIAQFTQAMTERASSIASRAPSATAWNGNQEVYERALKDGLRAMVPFSIAVHDTGSVDLRTLKMVVEQDMLTFAAMATAEQFTMTAATSQYIPRYSMSTGASGGGPARLLRDSLDWMGPALWDTLQNSNPEITEDNFGEVGIALGKSILPELERQIVRFTVHGRVEPRLREGSELLSQDALKDGYAHMLVRSDQLVTDPFTPPRIDEWVGIITRESREVMQGKRAIGQLPASDDWRRYQGSAQNSGTSGTPVALRPELGQLQVGGSGNLVGTTRESVTTRTVTIPAGSYANAHLLTGLDGEVGAGSGDLPVLLNMNYEWRGPARSRLQMNNLRLIGNGTPEPGPERMHVELTHLSYVFPSGRTIFLPVKGYVSDNLFGVRGLLGELHLNADRVVPLSILTGAGEGIEEAVQSNSTTTITDNGIVSDGGGDLSERVAYGIVGGSAGKLGEFVDRVLADVNPSIFVENGQRCSVVLLEPVVIDVPVSEWQAMNAASSGFSP